MWKVYRWCDKDILDDEGYIIYKANTWYLIGDYNTIDSASDMVKQEIYLDNCIATEDTPIPKFKIESDLK